MCAQHFHNDAVVSPPTPPSWLQESDLTGICEKLSSYVPMLHINVVGNKRDTLIFQSVRPLNARVLICWYLPIQQSHSLRRYFGWVIFSENKWTKQVWFIILFNPENFSI